MPEFFVAFLQASAGAAVAIILLSVIGRLMRPR